MAKCHNMGPFLSSHMAVDLPSAYPNMPFPGKPWTHMGSLSHLCTSQGEAKSISTCSLEKHFYHCSEHEHRFLFTFFFVQFSHICFLLIEAGTIWFQEYVKAVKTSCQVWGIIITSRTDGLCFVDLKLHHSG